MKHILVTGASRGIGHSISKALLDQGYKVTGTSRSVKAIAIKDPHFTAVELDLARVSQDKSALDLFVQRCQNVDALIMNAGYGRFGGIESFSHAQIDQLLAVNLVAQIQIVRAFMPMFKHRGSGDVVFLGSESALSAGRQGTIYSAAKFGLRGFSQALRKECANRNIRVGMINPGMVSSHFFDGLAFGPGADEKNSINPEQVAQAVLHMLQSPENVVFDEINLSPLKKVVVKKPSQS